MLCPSCGYKMNEDERYCKGCGTQLLHGPKSRGESIHDMPSYDLIPKAPSSKNILKSHDSRNAAQVIINKQVSENAAVKKAVQDVANKKAEEQAAKEAAESAAKDAAIKQAAAKDAAIKEKTAKEKAENAAKDAAMTETAAKKAAEKEKTAIAAAEKASGDIDKTMKEAARRIASKEAAIERSDAKKAAEKAEAAKEAAKKAAQDTAIKEAAAKKAAEEAERKKAAQEAAGKATKEAEKKKVAEEAAAQKAAQEAAAQKAAQETAAKKAAQEAAAKKAAQEAAAKKAAQETAAKKAAQETNTQSVRVPARLSYRILGSHFPSLSITLDENQTVFTQSDVMVWMSSDITINTSTTRKGAPFMAAYTSHAYGQEIGFASRFPGQIHGFDIGGGVLIVQKSAFLAAQPSVTLSTHVSMHLSDDAKRSFVFQRLSGTGMAFVAIGGSLIERTLRTKEIIKADSANIAAFEESVSFQNEMIAGFQNTLCDEDGLFLSTLAGPGKVWLQTIPPHA